MTTPAPLVGYRLNAQPSAVQLHATGSLYNYVLAANGLFVKAERPGLAALVPVGPCMVRGLDDAEAFVDLQRGVRVPENYLAKMLELSRTVCLEKGSRTEALFHLIWLDGEKRWRLDMPEQEATRGSVRPVDDGPDSSYAEALIEVHSHHEMDAFFSLDDDADEQGFRVYGVIGNIFSKPKLRVRVGCFGYFYELPATDIFELPDEISDALGDESPTGGEE